MPKLALVGTGFVATSLALALRPAKLFEQIAGWDMEHGWAQQALRMEALDEAARGPEAAVKGAAVVLVDALLPDLEALYERIGPSLSAGVIVTDTCTWRVPAMQAAAVLPESVSYVGGHPVLDGRGTGPAEARAEVFNGALYCLTPGPEADDTAIGVMTRLVSAAGAQAYFVQPEEHDGLAAGGELLPAAMGVALLAALTEDRFWPQAGRLAGDNVERWARMIEGIEGPYWSEAAANAEGLGRWIDGAVDRLLDLKDRLAAGDERALRQRWDGQLTALEKWRGTKRQLQESTMPPTSELRPSFLGSHSALDRLRGRGRQDKKP
ncbi:MAG: prephenate dehydrogenase [Chloroflexota bacterium]